VDSPPRLLVTCEHAGNRVPPRYAKLFRGEKELLASHRGWDPGALPLARFLARALNAPLRFVLTTRLLVDLNRSLGSPELFSEISGKLPAPERARILRCHYRPHRTGVEKVLRRWTARGAPALHLAVHTFTPVWKGKKREVEVGVLFDPRRTREKGFAEAWIEELGAALPGTKVRANEPYRGTDDGLTTEMRQRLPESHYLGIELEVSQRLAAGEASAARSRAVKILASLERALAAVSRR
jgi:predicted N-formylglutamate amidohydrolase